MTMSVHMVCAAEAEALVPALADVLQDCVEGGASVSFMAPLSRDRAEAFWREVVASVAAGEKALLVARDAQGTLLGTVQLVLGLPENQPHRAEIAKLLVHRRARRRGVGAALMQAAERAAKEAGKSLLLLDTAVGGDGEHLYPRLGWVSCGVVPDFALTPDGQLCATQFFYKRIGG